MNQDVLTLSPGGSPLLQTLGFSPASVICDNYTPDYLALPDVGKTIPPWTYGAVVALPPGLTRASATLSATTPAIPGPPVPLVQATLTWTDAQLPPDPGHLLQQVTTQQQNVLASVIAPAAGSNQVSVPVPAGTLSIGFAVRSEAIPSEPAGHFYETPQLVSIQGNQTDIEYLTTTSATATTVLAVPFDSSDTSVTVDLTANASDQSKIDVLAWPIAVSVAITQNPGALPIGVFLADGSGNPLGPLDTGLGGADAITPVSMFESTPAPWQAPNLAPIRIARTWPTTQATAVELIAAVAGERIYVFGIPITWDATAAASALHLVDAAHGSPSGGTIIADISQVVTAPAATPMLRLGVGRSLYAWADSGTPTARGVLSASQG